MVLSKNNCHSLLNIVHKKKYVIVLMENNCRPLLNIVHRKQQLYIHANTHTNNNKTQTNIEFKKRTHLQKKSYWVNEKNQL